MSPAKETDAVATNPENLPRRHKLTVTDYYRLAAAGSLRESGRVELLDGEIIDMTPIVSKHASKVGYLIRLLMKTVGDHGIREAWLVDIDNERLTVYRQPGQEGYSAVVGPASPGRTSISTLPDLDVDLGDLF